MQWGDGSWGPDFGVMATKQLCPQPSSGLWPGCQKGHSKGHPEGHDFCLKSFRSNHLGPGFTKAAQCYWGLDTTFKYVHTFRDATKQSQSGNREHQRHQVLTAMAAKAERLQGEHRSWRSLKTQRLHFGCMCDHLFFVTVPTPQFSLHLVLD